MYGIGKPAPVTLELIPARGEHPPVTATFNAKPSPLSLRFGRQTVYDILRDGEPRADARASDAFSAALIRHNLIAWTGIIDEGTGDVIEPTHDREVRNVDGNVTDTELGTISAFIAEPRLFEAADREYVTPWAQADAEKNGWAVSPSGTSAAETAADDTASTPVAPEKPAAATRARTGSKPRKRTRAKAAGS